jgi:hypothetical protein
MVGLIAGLAGALLIAAAPQDAARQDGWVVLPVDEYRALRARALPATPEPAPPPVDAALTRVDYELKVGADSVSGQARLTIDVLKQGWATVAVPPGMLVRDARIDGRPAALGSLSLVHPGAPARVLLSRSGRSTLTLDVVVPLAAAAGAESITLPAAGSALSSVALTVPRTGVALTVSGGFVAEANESGDESRWLVYGTPGRQLTFSWRHRVDDRRSALPLRTRARVTELVALGEDATQVTAGVQLDVTQGQAREAAIAIPEGMVVNQVAGPAVADWEVVKGVLTVTFLEPIETQASVVVSGEARTPREGAVPIPLLRVAAAERETGGVAVDVGGPGEIGQREPRGLEPADAADLGDVVAGHESPSMAAFRFTPLAGGAPRSLTVDVTRYTPKAVLVANVEEARYDALLGEDGKLLVRARYAVRNNQRSFLAVTLPPRATLWSAALAGRAVRPGVAPNGGLLLPLQKSRAPEETPAFVVEILYLAHVDGWNDKGEAHVELPAIDLPVMRTGVVLHHSPRYDVDARPGAFRAADDPGPSSAAFSDEPPRPAAQAAKAGEANSLQTLLDRVQKEAVHTRQGVVPMAIAFPAIGPTLFLAAELTPEAQPAAFDLQYRRSAHQADERGGR